MEEMNDILQQFCIAAADSGFPLDFTMNNLAVLEDYLLSQRPERDRQFANRASRYLGEGFRKYIGGKWELILDDPKNLYFKLPVITDYSDRKIQFAPTEVVANFIARPERGMFQRAIESHREFKK